MGQGNTKSSKFVLNHVFKNVSGMKEGEQFLCATEEYFSVPWRICIKRMNGFLGVFLHCYRPKNEKMWSIDTEYEIYVFHPNGKSFCKTGSYCFKQPTGWGRGEFMTWETMKKEHLVNDKLIVEVRVKRMYTTGIYKANLRNFNDEECSDVTLVVDDRKFHVAKLYLSTHSSSFRTKFVDGFWWSDVKKFFVGPEESKKPEVKLSGVDAYDLQNYLEALYGEDAIDEMTVEGILLLAYRYNTNLLVKKCEKFLLENSKKTLKKKLEMAVRYKLYALKNECLNEIKTIEDIRPIVPGCISRMNPSLMAVLFEKTLTPE